MTAEVELAATPLEAALADAWGAVLGIEPISRHDRFVELGGTSLAAEKVLVLLRRRLAVDLGAEVLVGQPTLAEIAARIETAQRTRFTHRTPAHRRLTNPEPTTSACTASRVREPGASASSGSRPWQTPVAPSSPTRRTVLSREGFPPGLCECTLAATSSPCYANSPKGHTRC